MKRNGDKCHLLVTTEKSVSTNIDGSNVTSKKEQKLLGIKLDSFLFFEDHITDICKNSQLYGPAWEEGFNGSVSYLPIQLLSINLDSTTLNNRINNIHERALRLTYKDNKSSFKQLIEIDHFVTVHHQNVQVLVRKIFKVKSNWALDIVKDVFELKEPPYNLRSESNHFTNH